MSDSDRILEQRPCDLLETLDHAHASLAPGDIVLVWCPDRESGERPVIIGRVGSAKSCLSRKEEPPCHLVLEAREHLSLKCGEGSITIRSDAKILIQGKDLVSRALRTNRIKGGAVSIN